jgi:hypothetical protein
MTLLGMLLLAAPAAALPDLSVTAINAYHNNTYYSPYFNLSNEVDVTVSNDGNENAGEFNVSLYADDIFIGMTDVPALDAGTNTTVQFIWSPVGCDCEDGCSPIAYTLKAIADCNGVVAESNEENNESTVQETAYWAGYSADEHLTEVIHGTIQGGLYYTTGDGSYNGLYQPGSTRSTNYNDIGSSIPAGAEIELARLNVYYTWSLTGAYPLMEVNITNSTGTYTVASDAEYNDRPCGGYPDIAFDYPWGNYVYDITDYLRGESTVTVTVKNVGPSGHSFCITPPGIVILYNDDTKPEYEYWLVEGADILEGGRRGGAGYLDLSECICDATFTGSVDVSKVRNAALGIVSAWGGAAWGEGWTSYYWFNDDYLGEGSMLGGYSSLYSRTVDDMSMYVGASTHAQIGANVSDVMGCSIADQDNTVSFGDDGDSMMAANAFLLIEYTPEAAAPFLISGCVDDDIGNPVNDPDVVITNAGEDFVVETDAGSNYYQTMTGSFSVSAGDSLSFSVSGGTPINHVVTQAEMDAGGFEQNLTGQIGICGDVTGNTVVNTGDVILLSNYVGYPGYTLQNEWAGDVTGNGVINTGDVILLSNFVGYPGYSLNCTI